MLKSILQACIPLLDKESVLNHVDLICSLEVAEFRVMTVKDDRELKQKADSHCGNSVGRRGSDRPPGDHRTCDSRDGNSILDFVELLPDRARFSRLVTNGVGWLR